MIEPARRAANIGERAFSSEESRSTDSEPEPHWGYSAKHYERGLLMGVKL
jgi:hypothetical protein